MDNGLFSTNNDTLLKRFSEVHNYIYANDGLSKQQVLDEILKILYIKIDDEINSREKFFIDQEEYESINNGDKGNAFLKRITDLFNLTKKDYDYHFGVNDKINLTIDSLSYAINKFQSIDFFSTTKDAKGVAFQRFLSSQEKSSLGQFFTPQPVIEYCVQVINPKRDEKVLDPACGSGEFLYSCLTHNFSTNDNKSLKVKYAHESLWGIDINKRIIQIAEMKFLLEGLNVNLYCHNALDDLDTLNLKLKMNIENCFDIILTNPPFGTAGKISNRETLKRYNLGYRWSESNGEFYKTNSLVNHQVPEILFIERCLTLLKPRGRMAIVLPNGHFENSSLKYLRDYIKNRATILGVVSLPNETFIPYGTGIKASILFLQKLSSLDKHLKDSKVFFSKISKVGYQGNKNGSPIYLKSSNGRVILNDRNEPIIDEDFSQSAKFYEIHKKDNKIESENSFSIANNLLADRMDVDYYSPKFLENVNVVKKGKHFPLSQLVKIHKGRPKILSNKESTVQYIELSDINTEDFEIINSNTYKVYELPSRASYEIKEGDILTSVAGNSIGTKKHASCIVSKEYEGSICSNGFRVLREFRVDKFYLLYFFSTDYFLNQVYRLRTGAAIPSISDRDFESVLVPIIEDGKMEYIINTMNEAINLKLNSRNLIKSISMDLE